MDIHDEWNGAAGDAFGVGTECECDTAAGNAFGNEPFPKSTATPPQRAPPKKSHVHFPLRQSWNNPVNGHPRSETLCIPRSGLNSKYISFSASLTTSDHASACGLCVILSGDLVREHDVFLFEINSKHISFSASPVTSDHASAYGLCVILSNVLVREHDVFLFSRFSVPTSSQTFDAPYP